MGDIPFWDVERFMRSERCRRRQFDVDILLPSALQGMKILCGGQDGWAGNLARRLRNV